MNESKQKNSENESERSTVLKTFVITCAVLCVPTMCMLINAWFYGYDGFHTILPHPNEAYLLSLAGTVTRWLPIIGFFGAIVSSWFVVRILKMKDKRSAALQTIVMTGGILVVIYIASTSLTVAASHTSTYGDIPSYLIEGRVTFPILRGIFCAILINVLTFMGLRIYAKYRN
jgi:hypothetical protein